MGSMTVNGWSEGGLMRALSWRYLAATTVVGLCAALSGCSSMENVEPAAEAGPVANDTLEGEVEILVAMFPDRVEQLYVVQTADGQRVRVTFDADPGEVQPGEHLALVGHWNNTKSLSEPSFTATTVLKHLGVETQAAGGTGTTSGAFQVQGSSAGARAPMLHRMAVIMVTGTTYTRAQVLSQINPGAGTAASYIGESSGGIDTFAGDVFGPYNIDVSDCWNRADTIAGLAKAAATADGHDLSGYTEIGFLLPNEPSCKFGGLGQVGRPGSTSQKSTWYNNWFDCHVVAHEVGHNLGMKHSHASTCGSSIYAANRASCSDDAYGNIFDIMGGANCGHDGHYNAVQKQYMGWLGSCEDVTAGGSAVFNLAPLEGSCGVRSLRIPIAGETNYYYLEYRKTSAGDFAGAQGQDRVLLTVANDGATVRPDGYLLDSTPASSSAFRDAWLAIGSQYTLPGNVQIKVLSLGELAKIQVTMPAGAGALCRGGAVPPSDGTGQIGLGCGDGCPSDPNKTAPGFCGCGVPDVDTDRDGTYDCADECPTDVNKIKKGVCGCNVLESACTTMVPGLDRKHYSGTWSTLPIFDQLTPDEQSVVSTINLADYANRDSFGVVFTGGVRIDTAGTYDFELSSDDGSRLRIDDREIVLNDGIHGLVAKTGSIALTAGTHTLRVEFFERTGGEGLLLRYRLAGGTFAEIPAALLVHPQAPVTDQCPTDPNKTAPGACGCNVADTDSDGDGVANCKDRCPSDAKKVDPGTCGCGVPEGTCGGSTTAQCVKSNEGATAQLACAAGQTISSINFASYGTPTGACGAFAVSSCNAQSSRSIVEAACLGKASCAVPATNGQFGDPCAGTPKVLAVEFACSMQAGLKRAHYTGTWSALPNFTTLTPDASDIASVIGVGSYASTEGFGLVFTGKIRISSAGNFDFELGSDDGSRLVIDGTQVVNNDGLHSFATQTGSATLSAGFHDLRVEFFERSGGESVRLRYRPTGGTLIEVPASVLFH